ncbi:hypothetical protein M0R36_10475 [bacterium]|jgi:hypothetical protein|nr:hypothetical protein [bacterium]
MKHTLNKSDAKFLADSIRFDLLKKHIGLMECAQIKTLLEMKDVSVVNKYILREAGETAIFSGGFVIFGLIKTVLEAALMVLVGNTVLKGAKLATGKDTTAGKISKNSEKVEKIARESESMKSELQKYKVELTSLKDKLKVEAPKDRAVYLNQLKEIAVKVIRKYRDAIALQYQGLYLTKGKDSVMAPGSFSKSSRILANVTIVLCLFALTKAGLVLAKVVSSLAKRVVNFMSGMSKKKESEVKGFVKSVDSASKSILRKKSVSKK